MWKDAARMMSGGIVRLEPLESRHESGLFEAAQDPEVWRWMPYQVQGHENFRLWFEEAVARSEAGVEAAFATVDARTGVLIGSTRYLALQPRHRSLEIGWTWLSSGRWNTGANLEAKLLMLGHAFERLGCRRVEFKTDARNERSRRALEKLPAKFEGVFRKHRILQNGESRDSAYYSITDEEWPEVEANLRGRLEAGGVQPERAENRKAASRKAASLAACVAHVLGVETSEVPDDGIISLSQWLAGRNLGLVPVESARSFQWPGRFIGLRAGTSSWAVFFGAPPGVLYDPAGEPEESGDVVLEAAFVLAGQDPLRKTGIGGGFEKVGEIELISLAEKAEAPMQVVSSAEAVAGCGLVGDRYEKGAGTFSNPAGRGYDLTLVEAEALEELAAKGVELAPEEARRNLVVKGIDLDGLIGRRFKVGEVECFGQRRCEPCAHLEKLTLPGVLRGLVHRGGLRADIISGGEIRVGATVKIIES